MKSFIYLFLDERRISAWIFNSTLSRYIFFDRKYRFVTVRLFLFSFRAKYNSVDLVFAISGTIILTKYFSVSDWLKDKTFKAGKIKL